MNALYVYYALYVWEETVKAMMARHHQTWMNKEAIYVLEFYVWRDYVTNQAITRNDLAPKCSLLLFATTTVFVLYYVCESGTTVVTRKSAYTFYVIMERRNDRMQTSHAV